MIAIKNFVACEPKEIMSATNHLWPSIVRRVENYTHKTMTYYNASKTTLNALFVKLHPLLPQVFSTFPFTSRNFFQFSNNRKRYPLGHAQ